MKVSNEQIKAQLDSIAKDQQRILGLLDIAEMTVSDVAKHYGISESAIYSRIKRKTLPCWKIGDSYRFKLEQIDPILRKKIEILNK